MRVSRRSVVVVAMALAGALALGAVALGSGNSTATFQFTPDQVPKDVYAKGSLFVHTHTDYTTAGTKTSRAQLNFDDDLKINTAGFPQCNSTSISGNLTLKQAMAACGSTKVGSGTAQANLTSPGDVHGCVLAFNGKPTGGTPTRRSTSVRRCRRRKRRGRSICSSASGAARPTRSRRARAVRPGRAHWMGRPRRRVSWLKRATSAPPRIVSARR